MTPEQKAREKIDEMLSACGWAVQDKQNTNLSAARGVAVAELSFKTGEPDYTLFVDGKALGTVEAKPEGYSLVPAPEVIAQEISDDLEAALGQFATIAEDLKPGKSRG